MVNQLASLILAAAAVSAINPAVEAPFNMTYNAGNTVDIKWVSADTGFINIDLVDLDSKILQFPMAIAHGVPSESGKYSWKVPASLKSASGYQVRVWGTQQPAPGAKGEGLSPMFTILNTIPQAVNQFTVLSPSKQQPCAAGSVCKIAWDFPQDAHMYPAMVDIALYRVGQLEPIQMIATVDSTTKSYEWTVPADYASLGNDVYISVSGQGQPPAGPSMSNEMAGNSQAFVIQQTPPAPESKPEKQDKKDDKPKSPREVPKVSGSTKKENAATTVKATALLLVLAAVGPALYFL